MSVSIPIPGAARIELAHLVMDVNGTLTDHGELIDGVAPRIQRLRSVCEIHLVSADTFGTLDVLARSLAVDAIRVSTGQDKLDIVNRLGVATCGVLGNGANDRLALHAAALGIVVLGPEGSSPGSLAAADLVCATVTDALDLLLDPRALAATLRP